MEAVALALAPQLATWGKNCAKSAFSGENVEKMKMFLADEDRLFKSYQERQVKDMSIIKRSGLPKRIKEYQDKMKMAIREFDDFDKGLDSEGQDSLHDFFMIDCDSVEDDIMRDMHICYFSYYNVNGCAGEGKMAWAPVPGNPDQVAAMLNVTTVKFKLSEWALGKLWRWGTGSKKSLPNETKEMICKRTQMSMLMNMKQDGFLPDASVPSGGRLQDAIGTEDGGEPEDLDPES